MASSIEDEEEAGCIFKKTRPVTTAVETVIRDTNDKIRTLAFTLILSLLPFPFTNTLSLLRFKNCGINF